VHIFSLYSGARSLRLDWKLFNFGESALGLTDADGPGKYTLDDSNRSVQGGHGTPESARYTKHGNDEQEQGRLVTESRD
jgi:hypothetical protein